MNRTLTPRRLAAAVARRASWLLQEERAVLKARVAYALGDAPSTVRVFRHCDDLGWLFVNTSGYRRRRILRKILPALPPSELQRTFIGSTGDGALREAWRAYCLWLEIAARYGRPIGENTRVLDFGCGWGRTLRFFLREVRPEGLFGADVLPIAVETCRRTNPWCDFRLVSSLPPTDFAAESFDLIYLYSVFSHLSESAHDAWLREFTRILRPGGLVIATTWHRDYIEWCERARQGDTHGTHSGSLGAFVGTEEWLARYDSGEYCHSPIGGDAGLSSDFYGETCIPETYVRSRWSDRFEICEYIRADWRRLRQNAIVARRR